MVAFESVLADALQLSVDDRERLIEALTNSLPLSYGWLEEIQRRSAALDRGETRSIPWEQVKAELKERSARRHGRQE